MGTQPSPEHDLDLIVSKCMAALGGAGHHVVAKVWEEDRAFDLALVSRAGRKAVIRCVSEPRPSDGLALATMLAEGDFTFAALVYSVDDDVDDDAPTFDTIRACHVSRVGELAALLDGET